MMADRTQVKQEMLGNTIFTNLVPANHQMAVSGGGSVMMPAGAMTVSLVPAPAGQGIQGMAQQPHPGHQHQPPPGIQMQGQPHLQQQHFPQQQFIQMYQLTPQQQQMIQCPQQGNVQQVVLAQIPNLVGGVGMPTMILTSNPQGMLTSGSNVINSSGNIIIATAGPGINGPTASLGELVQTISMPNVVFATSAGQDPNQPQIFAAPQPIDPNTLDPSGGMGGQTTHMVDPHSGALMKNGPTPLVPKTVPPSRKPAAFPCGVCNRSYKYRHGLTQHIQQSHMGKKPFPCKECGKAFTRRYQLERHVRLHEDSHDTHQCGDCGEVFHMRESYLLHIRSHHAADDSGMKQDAQDVSGMDIASSSTTAVDPTAGNEYPCDICGVVLNSRTMLVKHRRAEHAGNPLLSRPLRIPRRRRARPMGFSGDGNIVERGNSSSSGRFLCTTCGKRFLNGYGLKRHERTHTGERPHDCDICGLSFMERSHMKQHRMTHTGETPYHCHICQRGFSRKFSHQRHLRWHHEGTVSKSALANSSYSGAATSANSQGSAPRHSSGLDTNAIMEDLLESVVSQSLAVTTSQIPQQPVQIPVQFSSPSEVTSVVLMPANTASTDSCDVKVENQLMTFECCPSESDLMDPFPTSFTMQLHCELTDPVMHVVSTTNNSIPQQADDSGAPSNQQQQLLQPVQSEPPNSSVLLDAPSTDSVHPLTTSTT